MQDAGPHLVSILRDGLNSWLLQDNATWSEQFNTADALEKVHADYMVPALYNYDVFPDFRNTEVSLIAVSIQVHFSGQIGTFLECEFCAGNLQVVIVETQFRLRARSHRTRSTSQHVHANYIWSTLQ